MIKLYVIGDTHFGHSNIIDYCDRPFDTVEEMDKTMVKLWNRRVSEDDLVLHFGDVFFCSTDYMFDIMDKLNGNIYLIRGNHDKQTRTKLEDRLGFIKVYDKIKVGYLTLSHRPCEEAEYNIHAHTHDSEIEDNMRVSVSVERINYTPIRLCSVLSYLLNDIEWYLPAIKNKLLKEVNNWQGV